MKKVVCILLYLAFEPSVTAQVNLLNNLQACYPLDCSNNGIATNGAPTGPALIQSGGFYFFRLIEANGKYVKTGKLVIVK